MADYTFYYVQTFLSPLLVLAVSLCLVKYCCRLCKRNQIDVDLDSDLDPSNSGHVFVIPIPAHERDEQDSDEESVYRPPPYEFVCPPPSYAESTSKLNVSSDPVTPPSETETRHGSVEMPPPPYTLHLYHPPINNTHQS